MRVIAGSARSLRLKTPRGSRVRPTTDRIKETLFNMIGSRIPGSSFLDLFAGSGGIGIEALSRGADRCVFVDNSKEAVDCIRENLSFTKLAGRASVLRADVLSALGTIGGTERFDLVFLDPPYGLSLEQKVLESLEDNPCIDGHTLLIIEAATDTDFSWLETTGYEIVREKKYKTNRHVFVRRKESI